MVGVKPCPRCEGFGSIHESIERADTLCDLCGGRGYVNPALVCFNCGRPAYEVAARRDICGRASCKQEAEKPPAAVVWPHNQWHGLF